MYKRRAMLLKKPASIYTYIYIYIYAGADSNLEREEKQHLKERDSIDSTWPTKQNQPKPAKTSK